MENQPANRAKLWQIGGFALNNAATNLYLFRVLDKGIPQSSPGTMR